MKVPNPERNGDQARLRFTVEGVRHTLTWGRWSNPEDRAKLSIVAKQIYQDALAGVFDSTLIRYRCWLAGISENSSHTNGNGNGNGRSHTAAKISAPPLIHLLSLRLEENYNNADWALYKLLAQREPLTSVEKTKEFVSWLRSKGLRPSSIKRYLAIISVLRSDLTQGIRIREEQRPRPKPFIQEEVSKILQGFKQHPIYSFYYDLILLLFNTGMRTSEAIGLRWTHIDLQSREIQVYESLARNRGNTSKRIKKTTKTGKCRTVPINGLLYETLKKRPRTLIPSDIGLEDLVFRGPKGKHIDDHNLSQRAWRKILKQQGVRHRPLYTTRATFVSHAIASGMDPVEVAVITGHNVQVLYDHYLGSIKKPQMPELE